MVSCVSLVRGFRFDHVNPDVIAMGAPMNVQALMCEMLIVIFVFCALALQLWVVP